MDSSETNEGTSISVVTVTFNSEDHIGGCIASVARNAAGMAVEHVVIDNASKDESARIVTDQFPSVIFVQNELNRGLTVANNQGAGLARGRYVVFLNPDTIVPDGTFRTMLDIMERNPDIGVLAPRLVNEQRRFLPDHMGHRAPTAWTLINTFLLLNRLSDDIFPGILRNKDVSGLEDCDWACGACLMVRREVTNNFPWREFGSGDDLYYCLVIRDAGWRIALTGEAEVIHFGGQSFRFAKAGTWAGTPSNVARYLYEHRGPLHTAIGIAGMRLGLRMRGTAHYVLYLLARDPEGLSKANKMRQFLAHDDYSVFRKRKRPTPTSYPG